MAKSKPFSFAHLFGGAAAAAEDDEDNKAKKAKARRAEEEDDDTGAKDDDDDTEAEGDDEDDKPKGKSRAKRAEDDDKDEGADDDGDDDDDGKDARAARRAERTRCARIFGSKHAACNPALAASLAFNTGMSSSEAIRIMASSGTMVPAAANTSRRRSLDDRMREEGNVRLGPDNKPKSQGGKAALAEKMTSLYNNVTGKK